MGANALGEMIGLGIVAAVGVAMASHETSDMSGRIAMLAIMALAGIAEGVAVGVAQWRVLRWRLPAIAGPAWTLATAAGAFIAWAMGMIPSTLMGGDSAPPQAMPSRALMMVLAAAMGIALGPVLGIPQWIVLRRHIPRSGWWIAANSAAWGVGMPIIFLGVGVIARANMDPAAAIAAAAATCAAAGAAVGAVHGAVLLRLLALPDER
jgi:hypothetical protein